MPSEWVVFLFAMFFVFGIPLIIFGILFINDRKSGKSISKSDIILYNYEIGGLRLTISKKNLNYILMWLIPIIWLSFFIGEIFLIIFILGLIYYFRHEGVLNPKKTVLKGSESTQDLLDNLQKMQNQINEAKKHIEFLATEALVKQNEVEEKGKLTESLDKQIGNKLEEYKEWEKLSENQKHLVLQAAKEAISLSTIKQQISFAAFTIILNLMATIVWVLVGSPGKETILEFFHNLLTGNF